MGSRERFIDIPTMETVGGCAAGVFAMLLLFRVGARDGTACAKTCVL